MKLTYYFRTIYWRKYVKENKETKNRIIYYSDELNDEFAGDDIVAKKIDGNYRYIRKGILSRIGHIFWYRILATPLAFCYLKIYFHHKIVNKKVLKKAKGKPYFVYGNHTHFLADALIPTIANFPREVSVIVHANNVSMPLLGRITPSLGALPLPDDIDATKNFMRAIEQKVKEDKCIMIYPEAHIWPYYTDIRPFRNMSFRYPVKSKAMAFCLTNTYQKRRFSKRPKLVTYIDGPFYADADKNDREKKQQLRDMIYAKMKERSKNSNVKMIKYVKVEKNND